MAGIEALIGPMWPVLAALAGIVGAVWLRIASYRAGQRDRDTQHAADRAAASEAAHDRLNRAPTGDDVPADDLPDRLRAIADDFRSKRK